MDDLSAKHQHIDIIKIEDFLVEKLLKTDF
jgi:hypothetical protein